MKRFIGSLLLLFGLVACNSDLSQQATFSGNRQLQAVIETPAGSAHPMRYNPESGQFENEPEAGQDKVVRFLPYPVNAGFIPSTSLDTSQTVPGRPLPVYIISETMPSGTLLEIAPVGVAVLEQDGNLLYHLIAVPAKPSEQLLAATDYATFSANYPAAKKILELWLVQTTPQSRFMSWKNDKFAGDLVRKWMK